MYYGMNKKAIAILGAIFLLIVGTLGFLVYSKYSNKPAEDNLLNQNPPVNNATSTPPQDLTAGNSNSTSTSPSAVVKLTSDQVVSPALFYNGSGITYFDNQGNLFQAGLEDNNGQIQLTGKKQLNVPLKSGITKILWPAKGNDFIAQFTDAGGKTSWSYFNSAAQVYSDLPAQVLNLDWMPSGNQIMYVWLENNKATLNVSDPDSKNWKFLADMWENDNALAVSPDGSEVLYYETENSSTANAINSVSSDGKIWKGLVKNGQNFGVLWSPDSQKFLFAKKDINTQKYQLWIYNLTSGEVKNLGLFTTVEKSVWDKDSNVVYAAVPGSGSAVANSLTQDSFFRMDTTTLEKKEYSSGDLAIDGRNLFLNSTTDKLLFKNAQDGGLYYLDLTQ